MWVIDISKKKHRVVDDRWVKTNKYNDFKFTDHGLKCGRTYIAASYKGRWLGLQQQGPL
ncbi:hypothetical protein [Arthrobacter mobilis]|uniref:Uncharacterized protein n=1 Tax=Arthrobacter mobilis TaxID=2724944 RepID=A0A7X6K5N7_9MICC|nr:hypothetical protein [Arthrobacter mobilis]NKX53678.1 hypothetical protein [Arthrobacter mobilis]